MKKPKIPLFNLTVSPEAVREVTATLKSGWLTTGSKADRLEQEIGELLGVRHVAAVSSATSGMLLALQALGVSKGSEVITTPFTFVATTEVILHCGAKPVFVDIDPETLTIGPALIEKKINRKTACILAVDLAGFPCDYKALRTVGKKHLLPILSDSSHALASAVNDKSIAQLANIAVYSLHATKNLTSGEGGIVASTNKQLIERVRLLSRHAMTANAFQRQKAGKAAYDVSALGSKANLSDIHASVALGQMRQFAKRQKQRETIAARYAKNLAVYSDCLSLPFLKKGFNHSWHLYIIRLKLDSLKISRDQFIYEMSIHGIECGIHYRPIYEFSFYRALGYSGKNLPNTAQAGRSVLSLPMYPDLTLAQVDTVCDALSAVIAKYRR
ncbi:MAG: DegT/DnrJ/EryC1/StrS family aminotransferase [candidate division Zixibacteria bacterium]|nr:DegT/DnrJ/EryC1/StrS family aminotransferase [candidate division Zixibacteria bacterium]